MKTTKILLIAAAVTGALAALPVAARADVSTPMSGLTADELGCPGMGAQKGDKQKWSCPNVAEIAGPVRASRSAGRCSPRSCSRAREALPGRYGRSRGRDAGVLRQDLEQVEEAVQAEASELEQPTQRPRVTIVPAVAA
jgi:hypothetical protein